VGKTIMKNNSDPVSPTDEITKGVIRWVITVVIYIILMSSSLFLSAGTIDWLLARVYIGVAVGILLLDALVLIPISPDLLGERARYQEGAKTWDQLLSRWMATFGPLTIWIVSGLDYRYSWSDNLPAWIMGVSIGLVFLGGVLALWAMAANRLLRAPSRIPGVNILCFIYAISLGFSLGIPACILYCRGDLHPHIFGG
jgi:hypothetical protein